MPRGEAVQRFVFLSWFLFLHMQIVVSKGNHEFRICSKSLPRHPDRDS